MSDWPAIARRVRKGQFYVCFEEPDDPLVYAQIDNSGDRRDKGWDTLCAKDHLDLGCGWFNLIDALEDK